jgi:hypothetical protein
MIVALNCYHDCSIGFLYANWYSIHTFLAYLWVMIVGKSRHAAPPPRRRRCAAVTAGTGSRSRLVAVYDRGRVAGAATDRFRPPTKSRTRTHWCNAPRTESESIRCHWHGGRSRTTRWASAGARGRWLTVGQKFKRVLLILFINYETPGQFCNEHISILGC